MGPARVQNTLPARRSEGKDVTLQQLCRAKKTSRCGHTSPRGAQRVGARTLPLWPRPLSTTLPAKAKDPHHCVKQSRSQPALYRTAQTRSSAAPLRGQLRSLALRVASRPHSLETPARTSSLRPGHKRENGKHTPAPSGVDQGKTTQKLIKRIHYKLSRQNSDCWPHCLAV